MSSSRKIENLGLGMQVVKRDGRKEDVEFDKVLARIRTAGEGLAVNPTLVAQRVLAGIYDGVRTRELDEQAALVCTNLSTHHPDYAILASNIIISNHQKNTVYTFVEAVTVLYNAKDINGHNSPVVSKDLYELATKYAERIESMIDYSRDFQIDYFGFKTLERSYLLRCKQYEGESQITHIIERPQHMFMRVALGIHMNDFHNATTEAAIDTAFVSVANLYNLTSQKYYTHATPTLFNAGTPRQQLASCYLLAMQSDSIEGIYSTLAESALVSKYAGGIGIHIHNIRATNALIRGTNGTSNGIVPMLKVFNESARYVDQCFTPDTLVITQAGMKRIEDVTITDRVLTSTGDFHLVQKPLRHDFKGTMYKLGDVKVTPSHQVLALRNQEKGLNPDVIRNRLDKKLAVPEFCSVSSLCIGDFLMYPIPQYEYDVEHITEDDCRMYGILLGCGWISSTKSSIMTEKQTIVEFVENYCGLNGIITETVLDEKRYLVTWKTASTGFKFTQNQLHNIDPMMFHLPIEKITHVLDGFIESKSGSKNIVQTYNPYLSGFLQYANLRTGKLVKVEGDDDKGFTIHLPTSENEVMQHGGYIYKRIEKVEPVEYEGIVHDFEIDTVHNYTVAHLGICHNGGGRRPGSIAIYLEPWHADIYDFLEMKLNTGKEERRARDLFYAMWIPDLFMKRLEQAVQRVETGHSGDDVKWTLMCPDECKGLSDAIGDEFTALYESYEKAGKGRKSVPILHLWDAVLRSQIETGTPYLCYKDAANMKSNQQNLGTIKSSNLCVAPETLVLTRDGEFPIKELAGKTVEVWNGLMWSKTTIHQTGTAQKLITVVVSVSIPGSKIQRTLTCTPYHKFILPNGERVKASTLLAGQKLKEWVVEPSHLDSDDCCEYVHKRYKADIVSVHDYGRIDDTYCFNEPINHAGIFNGILTGNCSEIIEYSSPTETAVCNLASVCLSMFVSPDGKSFDFPKLRSIVKSVVYNLDRVIDVNFYPTENTRRSNLKHRPIGIGVQGLADAFAKMRFAYDSPEARELNRRIFAHMYYAAVWASVELAQTKGRYESFAGSPASLGKLQPDLWGLEPYAGEADDKLDWPALRAAVVEHGLRNSLLMAPMPTASTAQILGNNEAFEPFTSNIYTRNTSAGNFIIVNKYLVNELVELGIWSPDLRMAIISARGSVQGLTAIPAEVRSRYKTVWETKQRVLIDLAADRGAYICQSQSLNLFVAAPTPSILTSMHLYSWKRGLKTGIYYLRTQAKAEAQQFTVEPVAKIASGSTSDDDSDYESDEEPAPVLTTSARRKLEVERKKAEIRASMSTYDAGEGEQCLNCGS